MGYKQIGKNLSFAASGSASSREGFQAGGESLPLGEIWLLPSQWRTTVASR